MNQTTQTTTATSVKSDDFLTSVESVTLPKPGELINGRVINIIRNKILVDINGIAVGLIAGRESRDALGTAKKLEPGSEVSAIVLEEEGTQGYFILSLRKAGQGKAWDRFLKMYKNGELANGRAIEANKGGLLMEIYGVKGFLPVSQLAPINYPRVDDASSNEILTRLRKLIGQKFTVKIITVDQESGKLIFSEKAASQEQRQKSLGDLYLNKKIKGKVSGIVKFGIFVTFNGLEGLVHISEITWGHVSNPSNYGSVGDEVEAIVIGVDGDKISLSFKQLTNDPWLATIKKYKIDDLIEGVVNRINNYGAFVTLANDLNGLIHVSELPEGETNINNVLKVGQTIKAKIINLEAKEHRIGLSLKDLDKKTPAKKNKDDVKEEKIEKEEKEEEKAEKESEKKSEKKISSKK